MSTAPTLTLPAIISTQVSFAAIELDANHESGLNQYGRHKLNMDLRKAADQIANLFYLQDQKPKPSGDLMVVRVNIFTVGESDFYALRRAKEELRKAVSEGRASDTPKALARELVDQLEPEKA